MVKIFKHLNIDVEYVENQTCCGQPAFNSGYWEEIIPAAERFIEIFKDKEFVVAPSGSCVAMIRVFYDQLPINDRARKNLENLKNRIFEFTEFLVDVYGVESLGGRFAHRVTYHDSCHLNRELGVKSQPRKLLHGIEDLEFVEMENSEACCGFGGTFSYKFKDLSIEMVKRKCEYIESTGAEYCIGADSSCLMNIEGYLRKHGMKAKTMHIAELLAKSLNL